ncbi:unnamed protein product [Bursaphelenchus xylophilus]|uniref:(pine wood nematode) hypothetical protein n=1 Tax=Bursaphelenchus xylophilus TaxID=6326 RepID=A0A1I7SCK7_BURXY|nr:unnamed protein product [Bursaphelenchus xylophilus]CAG9093931.1 unnamed protein product [Bursaphelenchus xylophilus]
MGKLHGKLIREKRQAKKQAQKEKARRGVVPIVKKKQENPNVVENLKKIPKVDDLRERKGIKCIEPEKEMKIPKCPHGPCLLFTDGQKKWFGCSIYRSKDLCNYQVDVPATLKYEFEDAKPLNYPYGYGNSRTLFEEAKKKKKELYWCKRCFAYVQIPHNDPVEGPLKEKELNLIGKLIQAPKKASDGEAQYWFTGDVLKVLADNLKDYDSILCIGCPTVAEFVHDKKKNVFLLDYDHRLSNFYAPPKFAHYNLLAHHFYESDGVDFLGKFFKNALRTLIVVDPPFGAQVEPIVRSLQRIQLLYKEKNPSGELTQLVFLPLFLEKFMHDYKMLDFKVTYTNHRQYSDPRKTPVRMFTTAKDMKKFVFPAEAGYKLCKKCSRYVSAENEHCRKCNSCTTKMGPTYKHCDMCEKCVKPTYKHCVKCLKCHLPNRCLAQDR